MRGLALRRGGDDIRRKHAPGLHRICLAGPRAWYLRSAAVFTVVWPASALAHEPSELAKQRMLEGGFGDAAWLGAEHMLTGYDHLLFLLGVLFFLSRPVQIVSFITAFTLGHALVLLIATPLGIRANPYLIDALIALTVVYKALENLGWFRRAFRMDPPALLPVIFGFGLIHGLGLSARLQEMALATDPRFFGKIIAFNVGVELGQLAALAAMGGALFVWRHSPGWPAFSRGINVVLVAAGFALFALQLHSFFNRPAADAALVSRTDGPMRASASACLWEPPCIRTTSLA